MTTLARSSHAHYTALIPTTRTNLTWLESATPPSNMAIVVTPMTEADVDGAVDCVQKAFADDPYNRWVFNRRENVFVSAILFG